MKSYETVLVLTPTLSEEASKEQFAKFRSLLTDNEAEIIHEDNWGLKKLAYPIRKKSTGYYQITEFKALNGDIVNKLEIAYKRNENVLRFLTVSLDKEAAAYNERKRTGTLGPKVKKIKTIQEQ